ncbi:MAG: hypothetical protein ACI9X4_002935 [Glaciecola sp.]|jgi:hypothetical protein
MAARARDSLYPKTTHLELMPTSQTKTRIAWAAQIVAAIILGQTLFFKFTAAPEAVALFTKLGVEPWGRVALGVVELIAVILLLVPRTAVLGSALTLGLMVGALGSHLTKLGIEVEGDGGALFTMAVIAFVAGLTATWIRRKELPVLGVRFFGAIDSQA